MISYPYKISAYRKFFHIYKIFPFIGIKRLYCHSVLIDNFHFGHRLGSNIGLLFFVSPSLNFNASRDKVKLFSFVGFGDKTRQGLGLQIGSQNTRNEVVLLDPQPVTVTRTVPGDIAGFLGATLIVCPVELMIMVPLLTFHEYRSL